MRSTQKKTNVYASIIYSMNIMCDIVNIEKRALFSFMVRMTL